MNIELAIFINRKSFRTNIYVFCISFLLSIFSYSSIKAADLNSCIDLMIESSYMGIQDFNLKLKQEQDQKIKEDKTYDHPLTRTSFLTPNIKTREDQMKVLSIILQDIPEVFNLSLESPVNFIPLLIANNSLLSKIIKAIPNYKNILQQRPALLDINISKNLQEPRYLDRTLAEVDVKRWILSLKNTISYFNQNYPNVSVSYILDNLIDIYIHTLDLNGILGALHNIIPNSRVYDKNSFLSYQDRLDILSKDLVNNFNNKIIKWDLIIKSEELKRSLSSRSDKEKITYILNSQTHLFNLISILIMYSINQRQINYQNKILPSMTTFFKQTIESLDSLNTHDLYSFIDSFKTDNLKYLGNNSSLIKEMIVLLLKNSKDIESISKLIISDLRSYFSSKQLNNSFPHLSLRIKEVLPISAIFRGYVGKDCSSNLSFAYPHDPFERVFFVYNDKNETLGYISSTEILINNKKSLYIHTISGSYLSSFNIRVILDVFNSIKKELYVETISYPILSIARNNINHPEIINEFQLRLNNSTTIQASRSNILSSISKLLLQKDITTFNYQYPRIRNFISRLKILYNTDKYDGIDKNYRLKIEDKDTSIDSSLNISVEQRKESEYNLYYPYLYKKIVLSLWKALESKGFKMENIRNITNVIKLDTPHIGRLFSDLLNKDKLDIQQYISHIQNKYGIKLTISDLSLETLARMQDFMTNKDIQSEFIKKLSSITLRSIYLKDSFEIIAERIKLLSSSFSKRLKKELNNNKTYTLLSNPEYVMFSKISNDQILAIKADSKFILVKISEDSHYFVISVDSK